MEKGVSANTLPESRFYLFLAVNEKGKAPSSFRINSIAELVGFPAAKHPVLATFICIIITHVLSNLMPAELPTGALQYCNKKSPKLTVIGLGFPYGTGRHMGYVLPRES